MRALVIGATGMDGRLMTEYLLRKGYEVIGTYNSTQPQIKHDNLRWVEFDLCDNYFMHTLKNLFPLDEIYNFGGITYSPYSLDLPDYTIRANFHAPLEMIEYVVKHKSNTKFFQASSSEVFGNVSNTMLTLNSPRKPHTPYAYAKNMVDFACEYFRFKNGKVYNAISFNHEHHYRKPIFLTRKISLYVAEKVVNKKKEPLSLGNINAKRDWSRATTFIDGYYKQMQGAPSELLFSSEMCHSVMDILEIAFGHYGMRWEEFVRVDDKLIRANDRDNIYGDSEKAIKMINFVPDGDKEFERMIIDMVENDVNKLKGNA